MRITGHSSITVSQRYVHPSPEAVEKAFERLQLYGTAIWNAFDNTAGVNIEDIPSLATKRGTDPYQNFGMTVRQMRFGVRLQGPNVFGAALTGVAEMDFFGETDALANGVGMDIPPTPPRLWPDRLAECGD